jgi:hypothetical protein
MLGTEVGVRALATRFTGPEEDAMGTISKATAEQLTNALGEAVVHIWSYLPPDTQHDLFEEAITARGESIRQQLALFLHEHHVRTVDLMARAVIEPDSLGG